MLINALKDLNSLPASESRNDDSSRGCFTKPCNGNMNEMVEEKQKKSSPIHVNGGETVNSGVEVANSEVEYFESENLSDLENIDTNVFTAFNDHVVDLLDPLLVQLLLKSPQYKKFVCEAAERALEAMTTWVSAIVLLSKLQPYLKNGNPRIRAKASMCFSRSVLQLLPESREAAQTPLLELETVYKKSYCLLSATVHEHPELDTREHFCQSKLSPLSARAVFRVTNTNVAWEGLLVSS
ncbi:hypothetical protein SLE2022_280080 [Rubroshorea leprosula]